MAGLPLAAGVVVCLFVDFGMSMKFANADFLSLCPRGGAGGSSRRLALPLVVLLTLFVSGCSGGEESPAAAATSGTGAAPATAEAGRSRVKRWYGAENVSRGAAVFAENCVGCHGKGAQGAFTWRRRNADGSFPPPPLDGSGHAWHHPLAGLAAHIRNGAAPGQGSMPGFGAVLKDTQINDAIAWFQSKWSDTTYKNWLKRVGGAPG